MPAYSIGLVKNTESVCIQNTVCILESATYKVLHRPSV